MMEWIGVLHYVPFCLIDFNVCLRVLTCTCKSLFLGVREDAVSTILSKSCPIKSYQTKKKQNTLFDSISMRVLVTANYKVYLI